MENEGGGGSAGSHWERTVIYNEYMVGIIPKFDSIFTRFTFNLFKDTGWYYNLTETYVEDITWGKGKGCEFFYNTCKS